jgi:hypothetical protein
LKEINGQRVIMLEDYQSLSKKLAGRKRIWDGYSKIECWFITLKMDLKFAPDKWNRTKDKILY